MARIMIDQSESSIPQSSVICDNNKWMFIIPYMKKEVCNTWQE